MASPQLECETYRISEVPYDICTDDVKQWFPRTEQSLLLKISGATAAHFPDPAKPLQVFIVTFAKQPPSLKTIKPDTGATILIKLLPNIPPSCGSCSVDAHFQGLTPLNDGPEGEDAVDLVAVTGVGGRPFGSWQCENTSMWLRDLLPGHVPNLRTFVYGHRLKVVNSDQHSNLESCTEGLLDDLKIIRPEGSLQRRPLMLLGHSLGGIVVKYAWILCAERSKKDDKDRNLYHAIHSLILFGTPHNGIRNQEMLTVAAGQPAETLLRDLGPGSTTLKNLRDRFARLDAQKNLKVLSCCEYQATPTSQRSEDGKVRRDGPLQWMVTEDSACLHWNSPAERVVTIPENHSMMVKLSAGISSKYQVIKNHIAEFTCDAVKVVPKRFHRAATIDALSRSTEMLTSITLTATRTRQSHEIIARHALNVDYTASIHKTIEDETLGKALFEDRATPAITAAFSEKANEIASILSPWSNHMIPRGQGKARLAKTIQEIQIHVQSLWHMLLLSMLPAPIGMDLLGDRSFTRAIGLPRIASLQRLQAKAASSEGIELLTPMSANLQGITDANSERAQGLQIAQLQQPVLGFAFVVVEYKRYAEPLGKRGRPRLENDEKNAILWKKRAQTLATLLNKSSSPPTLSSYSSLDIEGLNIRASMDDDDDSSSLDLTTYTFRCIGYLDEHSEGRLALIYEVPPGFIEPCGVLSERVRTLEWLIQGDLKKLPLEERFNLALRLCAAVLSLHSSGWVHKSIRSSNVVLFQRRNSDGEDHTYEVYLKGFEFSREALGKSDDFERFEVDGLEAIHNLYRHPQRQGLPMQNFKREHDIFALGVVLLEIGTCRTMEQRMKGGLDPGFEENYVRKCLALARDGLPQTMGNRYAKAVERCLNADFEVEGSDSASLGLAFQQLVIEEIVAGVKL